VSPEHLTANEASAGSQAFYLVLDKGDPLKGQAGWVTLIVLVVGLLDAFPLGDGYQTSFLDSLFLIGLLEAVGLCLIFWIASLRSHHWREAEANQVRLHANSLTVIIWGAEKDVLYSDVWRTFYEPKVNSEIHVLLRLRRDLRVPFIWNKSIPSRGAHLQWDAIPLDLMEGEAFLDAALAPRTVDTYVRLPTLAQHRLDLLDVLAAVAGAR
jgi:hypothetical protein